MSTLYLYCLTFPNGKKYIGVTTCPMTRLDGHISDAKKQKPYPVRAAIRKYGIPQLQILCVGPKDYIKKLEITAIEHFQTRDDALGYNVARGGLGRSPSSETRAKAEQLFRVKYGFPTPPGKSR